MFFTKNKYKKLQEEEDSIYKNIILREDFPEINDYFEIYLNLMNSHIGNVEAQWQCSYIFSRYLNTFTEESATQFSDKEISDMQCAGMRSLLSLRNS